MRKQRGFFNMDLRPLFVLAIIGLVAVAVVLFVGVPFGVWWLWHHVAIV